VDVGGNQDSVEHDKRPGHGKEKSQHRLIEQEEKGKVSENKNEREGERNDDRERNKRGKVKIAREKKTSSNTKSVEQKWRGQEKTKGYKHRQETRKCGGWYESIIRKRDT
jgi:hypothetical protein